MNIKEIEWADGGRNKDYWQHLRHMRPIRAHLRKLVEAKLTQIEELFNIIFEWKKKDELINITLDLGHPIDYDDEAPFEIELFSYEEGEYMGALESADSSYTICRIEFEMKKKET